MQVGDEVKRLLVVLQGDVLADRAEVVAPVDRAGRLDAGENTHDFGLRIADCGVRDMFNPQSAILQSALLSPVYFLFVSSVPTTSATRVAPAVASAAGSASSTSIDAVGL